jgi:type I restriction enzyme, S subunit
MPKLSLNASKKTKHTPAGKIPVDWAWAALGKVSTIKSGGTPSRKNPNFWGGNIPWVKTGEIRNRWITSTSEMISEQGLAGCASGLFHSGTILLAMYGQGKTRGQVVRLAITAAINQACAAIIATPTQVDSNFLYFDLESRYDEIRDLSNTGNQENLNAQVIRNLPIPLPPLPEQRRIASILSTWDRSIETLESLVAAKTRRKQALMQQLLSGKKRLPGFSGRWSVRRLGDAAENVSLRNNGKFSWDRLYAVTKADGMVPMREQVMGVTSNNCKLVKRNFFAYNPMRLNIGSLARWQRDEEVMVSGDYIVFRCKEGELEPRFFDHLRRTTQWQDFVNVGGSGSVRVRLYFKDIAPFKFPCPEFKEQKALADFFDTIDRELTLHRQHLDSLRTQKRGLMQKLLTGEVRT